MLSHFLTNPASCGDSTLWFIKHSLSSLANIY